MDKNRLLRFGLLSATAASALVFAGCATRAVYTTSTYSSGGGYYATSGYDSYDYDSYGIVVGAPPPVYYDAPPPPPPRYEARPMAPGPGLVWVDGYWDWRGGAWAWQSGRWVRPRAGYVYSAPTYDYSGGRVSYVRPHWQPSGGGATCCPTPGCGSSSRVPTPKGGSATPDPGCRGPASRPSW